MDRVKVGVVVGWGLWGQVDVSHFATVLAVCGL